MTRFPRHGVTLLELLVVVALVGVLLALLLPAVQSARLAATSMRCSNQMRQIGLATHVYSDARGGDLPFAGRHPGSQSYLAGNQLVTLTSRNMSVFACLLPEIDGAAIAALLPAEAAEVRVRLYVCPLDSTNPSGLYTPVKSIDGQSVATSSYVGNTLSFFTGSNFFRSFADGTSNTVLVAERVQLCEDEYTAWARLDSLFDPTPALTVQFAAGPSNCRRAGISTSHRPSMPLLMGDGSVRYLSVGVDMDRFYPAFTPAAGDLTPDW